MKSRALGGYVEVITTIFGGHLLEYDPHATGLIRFSFSRPMIECVPTLKAQAGQFSLWQSSCE